MICIQCDKDVADCICDDRIERLTVLLDSKNIVIGDDYRRRIQANLDNARKEQDQQTKAE